MKKNCDGSSWYFLEMVPEKRSRRGDIGSTSSKSSELELLGVSIDWMEETSSNLTSSLQQLSGVAGTWLGTTGLDGGDSSCTCCVRDLDLVLLAGVVVVVVVVVLALGLVVVAWLVVLWLYRDVWLCLGLDRRGNRPRLRELELGFSLVRRLTWVIKAALLEGRADVSGALDASEATVLWAFGYRRSVRLLLLWYVCCGLYSATGVLE